MKREELKDGVFYKLVDEQYYSKCILLYNFSKDFGVGYWLGVWGKGYEIPPEEEVVEATLEELNALGDEHLPYSKYLQNNTVINTPEFKVGDRVRVISGANMEGYDGRCGTIDNIDNISPLQPNIRVAFENGDIVWCYPTKDTVFNVEILEKEVKTNPNVGYPIHDMPYVGFGIDPLANPNKGNYTTAETVYTIKEVEPKMIRRFTTGAVRSNSAGRPRPDWVSPYAVEEISKVLVDNANDFGGANYLLGIPELECLESLMRHTGELQEALTITKDMEVARKVARAVGFNVVAMLHTMVLKEKGLYNEIFDKTELVTLEEARKANQFINS